MRLCGGLLLLSLLATPAIAGTDGSAHLTLLHTNDIHDHVRPGDRGVGGLPYVSGYVNQMREGQRPVLLIDAGDGAEKGDMVAFMSNSEITFQAMGRMAYDAIAVGNHEHNFGLAQVKRFNRLSGERMLALNLLDADGAPLLAPSRVVVVDGLRVGLIGMALPRDADTLDFAASAQALAEHVAMLRTEQGADLIVVAGHVGVPEAAEWARAADTIDVFISGHTHQPLAEPVRVDGADTIIVQAGSNARWVGELELRVDRASGRVVDYRGRLVEMKHDRVPLDEAMAQWVAETEARLAPRAGDIVAELDRPLGWYAIARLSAEAIRRMGDAEIGLYHPTHIVRNALPAGTVNVNALFRTAADRGHPLVITELYGTEIDAYLSELAVRDYDAWGQTQWAGFTVRRVNEGDGQVRVLTNLEPKRRYRVVMPEREWDKRLMRMRARIDDADHPLAARKQTADPAGFHTIDALIAHLEALGERGERVGAHLEQLALRQGDPDPMEATLEPQTLARMAERR